MTNSRNRTNRVGRGDGTVMLPNPGGRRPAPPTPPPPGESAPEDWIAGSEPPPAPPERAAPKLPPLHGSHLFTPHANPIMRAAGPLLQLLGRLRVGLLQAPSSQIMEQVADAIQAFEKDIRAAGITAEQARVAKYALCATADDIVQNIPRDDRHVWTQYSMLSRFFGERIGGVRFFEELDRAKLDPTTNYSVLELQHACLALGFQGIHRTSGGGAAALQQIQRNLYEMLRQVRRSNPELSPHWQGQQLPLHAARHQVPLWAVTAVAAALLAALYIVLRLWLGGGADAVAEETLAANPATPVSIQRRVPAPPPPQPRPRPSNQIACIRSALASEISGGKLTADEAGNQIVVRVGNLILFPRGDASVQESFKPIAAHLGAALECQTGLVRVVGHTDSDPIHSVRFPSNWHLSVARAEAVARLLKQHLSKPDRIKAEGNGADAPIADNRTPEGRAKNRRVEILITRSD
jgi:type VI secretion system protein ImpK